MRNFLIIVVGIIILNAALLYSGGFTYIKDTFTPVEPEQEVKTDINEVFKATLEKEVREKAGTPIEGYEPAMFLQVFPGLVATDFNGVEASIGKYVIVEGKLIHQLDNDKLIHSAAGAISRKGMQTLLVNVSKRIGVNLQHGGTLTEIMEAISSK